MPVALSIALAVVVAAGLVLGSRFWFDRVQQRAQVRRIGIDVLGARHWRDALSLLVMALEKEGFGSQNELVSGAPSGERILRRGNSTVLLIYKHGTAYRIGAPALLDAETRRQGAGIDEVMIATLGTVDAEVIQQAERMKIALLDGNAVWARLGAELDEPTRRLIDAEATAMIERPRRLATLGAAVLGLGVVVWGGGLHERIGQGTESPVPDPIANVPSASPRPAAVAADAVPGLSASDGLEADAGDPREIRKALVRALKALPEIDNALWASGSTVVVSMRARADIDQMIGKACALSTEFPELLEVRLQIESNSGADVRWRRCT